LARDIDPKSMIIRANLGFVYYLAGDYNRAEEVEKNVIQMDPSFIPGHGNLGQIYLAKKQYAEAIDQFRTALSLSPGYIAGEVELASAYAVAGKKAEAEEILQELEKKSRTQYVSQYDWAMLYSGFRDKEKTLKALEEAYAERNPRLVNLAVHPQFAFLRGEPRFEKLLKQIGLNISGQQGTELIASAVSAPQG
jgi:tetratricopeptide (TPR) repeat protein